jgi:hypothetical protein
VIIDNGERRVVGVVRNASVYRLDRVEDVMFRPIDRTRVPVMLIRSSSPAISQLVTAAAERIDPRVHVRVDSIAGNVERQLGGLRTIAELAGVLGMIALALATVGVFSVFAYFVQRPAHAKSFAALGAVVDADHCAGRGETRTGRDRLAWDRDRIRGERFERCADDSGLCDCSARRVLIRWYSRGPDRSSRSGGVVATYVSVADRYAPAPSG